MPESKIKSYQFGDFVLEVENCRLLKADTPVSLTHKSFEVLLFLLENRGKILKKEELLDHLWEGNYVEEANLTQHIYMLRKVLKQTEASEVFIETIPKNGYRFAAEVRESLETPDFFQSRENFYKNNGGTSQNGAHELKSGDTDFDKNFQTVRSGEFKRYREKRGAPGKNAENYLRKKILFAGGFLFAAVFILSAVYVSYFLPNSRAAAPRTVAVLPFEQIGRERDEKLGIGIADILIARLANIEELTVRPTSSVLRFAEGDKSDLFEIGDELDARFVIAGTIQKEENLVRVTAQFYSVEDKRQIWILKFDEPATDVFSLQDKISEKIARKLLADSWTN